MKTTDVIAAIDGSPASDAVLRWAEAEAAATGARLRVVLAYHWRRPRTVAATQDLAGLAHGRAEVIVEAATEDVHRRRPGIAVSGHAVFGDAADVLTGMAADAAMVVVGSRGHTALSAALGAGVGTRVATHAHGCVVVVRGRAGADAGPVVVGVDGSHTDNRLLHTAFEEAARRGCGVVAIRCFADPAPPWGIGIPVLALSPAPTRATLHAELADDVERWREKYPGVPAEARMPCGDPASVLLDASREAQLLVVGGRGTVSALLLGSVSHRMLLHSDCPVLIARGD